MTGGTVVILGKVGDNFAAGMTGGMAFIYDPNQEFENYVNSKFCNLADTLRLIIGKII